MVASSSESPVVGGQDDAAIVARSKDAQALLGRPPLVRGEDGDAYGELLARVQAAVAPKDVLEEFWVRDVVDLSWEAVRLRRMKANLITAATYKALERVLAPIVDREPADGFSLVLEERPSHRLAGGWYRREEETVNEVEEILRGADLSIDVVTAIALGMSLDDIERIDRMVTNAEVRRNAVLREVARHRAAFAEDLRRSSGAVRDAEFTEVPRT